MTKLEDEFIALLPERICMRKLLQVSLSVIVISLILGLIFFSMKHWDTVYDKGLKIAAQDNVLAPAVALLGIVVTITIGIFTILSYLSGNWKAKLSTNYAFMDRHSIAKVTTLKANKKGLIPYLEQTANYDVWQEVSKPGLTSSFMPWQKLELIQLEIRNDGRGELRFSPPTLKNQKQYQNIEALDVRKNGKKYEDINSDYDARHTLKRGETMLFSYSFYSIASSLHVDYSYPNRKVQKSKLSKLIKRITDVLPRFGNEQNVIYNKYISHRTQKYKNNLAIPIIFSVKTNDGTNQSLGKNKSYKLRYNQVRFTSGNYLSQLLQWAQQNEKNTAKLKEDSNLFYRKVAQGDLLQMMLPAMLSIANQNGFSKKDAFDWTEFLLALITKDVKFNPKAKFWELEGIPMIDDEESIFYPYKIINPYLTEIHSKFGRLTPLSKDNFPIVLFGITNYPGGTPYSIKNHVDFSFEPKNILAQSIFGSNLLVRESSRFSES